VLCSETAPVGVPLQRAGLVRVVFESRSGGFQQIHLRASASALMQQAALAPCRIPVHIGVGADWNGTCTHFV
jgi:hypothetical protein